MALYMHTYIFHKDEFNMTHKKNLISLLWCFEVKLFSQKKSLIYVYLVRHHVLCVVH